MVDRQTPTVESDEDLARDAEASREAQPGRETASAATRDDTEGARASETTRAAEDDRRAETARQAEADDAGAKPAATTPTTPATAAPIDAADRPATSPAAPGEAALFDRDATKGFQDRWLVIQTEFVDEPRKAVEEAEALVGEVVESLTSSFARQRKELEARWNGDEQVSTEDLRLAIRRYRSFFNRLLAL